MFCKKCKTHMVTMRTKYNAAEQELYRRRMCPKCGHTIYTVEFKAVKNDRFEEDWSKSRTLYTKSVKESEWVQEDMFDLIDRLMEETNVNCNCKED